MVPKKIQMKHEDILQLEFQEHEQYLKEQLN